MATKISAKAKSHPDVGMRAKSAAHTDAFMRGDRYGTIVGVVSRKVGGVTQTRYLVESDRTGKIRRVAKSSIELDGRLSNPASACAPVRRGKAPFNSHEGQSITYKGTRYRIMGCGVGATAKRSIGAQEEGTYALLNEKTNRVIYVAKRVVRDILYRRGREGAPAPRGPRTASARKRARAKMTPAEKAAWKRKMDRAKAAKAGR